MTKAKPKNENKKTVKKVKTKTEKATTKPKEKAKKQVKTTTKKKVKEEKITFSVFDHILVPKHEIVSDSEVPEILKQYNIQSKSQFPKILSDDVVVKEIGAKVGNVLRIYRKEPTGDCLYYRVVV